MLQDGTKRHSTFRFQTECLVRTQVAANKGARPPIEKIAAAHRLIRPPPCIWKDTAPIPSTTAKLLQIKVDFPGNETYRPEQARRHDPGKLSSSSIPDRARQQTAPVRQEQNHPFPKYSAPDHMQLLQSAKAKKDDRKKSAVRCEIIEER